MQIGVIADTHSKMRPEALEALKGSDLILHAGEVAPAPGVLLCRSRWGGLFEGRKTRMSEKWI